MLSCTLTNSLDHCMRKYIDYELQGSQAKDAAEGYVRGKI